MQGRQLRFAVLAVAFVLNPACRHVALGAGEDAPYWKRLSLPSRWAFAPVEKKSFDDFERSITTPELAFRLQSGHLLIAGSRQSGVQAAEYSLLQYTIDPQSGKVTSAKAADWNAGLPIGTHVENPFRDAPTVADNNVSYGHRRFRARGEIFEGYALSPDGNWLALLSWDGTLLGGDDFFIDSTIGSGKLFLEIYRVSTGKKTTEQTASFFLRSPARLFERIVWVSDRYLIVPNFDKGGSWLCDVRPGESPSAVAWDLLPPGAEILGFVDEPDISGDQVVNSLRRFAAVRVDAKQLYGIDHKVAGRNGSTFPLDGGTALLDPGIRRIQLDGRADAEEERLLDVRLKTLQKNAIIAVAPDLGPVETYPPSWLSVQREEQERARPVPYRKPLPANRTPAPKPADDPRLATATWKLTGQNKFEYVDENHDGLAEFLHIEIGTATNIAGCSVWATLTSPQNVQVASFITKQTDPSTVSLYADGSVFKGEPAGQYTIDGITVYCGEPEKFLWSARQNGDPKILTPAIDPKRFQNAFHLTLSEPQNPSANHVEYRVDCMAVAPLRFPITFQLSVAPGLDASIKPDKAPCGPNAARITVTPEKGLPPGIYDSRVSAGPAMGVSFEQGADFLWKVDGVLTGIGVLPNKGSGPGGIFHVSAYDTGEQASKIVKVELLFADGLDDKGGCLISYFDEDDNHDPKVPDTRRLTLPGDNGQPELVSRLGKQHRVENLRCYVDGYDQLLRDVVIHFKPPFFGTEEDLVRVTKSTA